MGDVFSNIADKIFGESEITKNKHLADSDPRETQSVQEIIEAAGYVFEKHDVKTEDGFILEMHRVNAPGNGTERKPAVLLQHGILSSSETFILNGDESAAFLFADEGYDVWLGNNRGTLYGRKHEKLNPERVCDQEEFFDYSFFELGKYDVPA